MRYGLGVYGKTVFIYIALTVSVFGMLGMAQAQEKSECAQSQVAESESSRSAFDQRESVKKAINTERERIHQRIEMIRMWSLVSILNLDEDTAKSFFPVVNEIRERRVRLTIQINSLKKQLAVAASKPERDDKEIERLIAEYRAKMSELNRLGDEEFDRLSKILDPVQQVQYIVFGDRFHQDLQIIIRQAQTQAEKNRTNEDNESAPTPQDQPDNPKN